MTVLVESVGLLLLVVLFCGCSKEDEARTATSATDGGTHSVSDASVDKVRPALEESIHSARIAVHTGLEELLDVLRAEQAGRLFKACREGDVDAVNALLGQDPGLVHTRDAGDRTALHVAGTVAVAEVLVTYGADVNARRSHTGFTKDLTPLHVMADRDAIEIARLLLENGADVNARAMVTNTFAMQQEGHTPLSLVVGALGSTEMIRLLLEYGADPHLRAEGWGSPFEKVRGWAPDGLREEVLGLMLRHGMAPNGL